MPRVTFKPDNVTVEVEQGENLLRAAMMADVRVTASCGGAGTCGKCRMVLDSGDVRTKHSSRLTAEEAAKGYVLACTTDVLGDVVATIPAESRPGSAPARARSGRVPNRVLSAEDQAARLPDKRAALIVTKRAITVAEPDLADNSSDLTRARAALRRQHSYKEIDFTLSAARALPAALRDGAWTVTATLQEQCAGTPLVTRFASGDSAASQLGVAVDIGTTTVEVALIDLGSRETLAQAAEYNAQVDVGEDVITRVIAASKRDGLPGLQSRVLKTVRELTDQVLSSSGHNARDISAYVMAGNTVMTHLLLGVTPAAIRTSPYVPAASTFPWATAGELGLPGDESTAVITMPCPASWLGGDIVAGVVASGIPWRDELTLFVDIGTNGEIVLGNKDFLVACSCSAGPAFEGGGIASGMRAAEGAVEQVRIDAETLEPAILTIGQGKPVGICGSGLIDCVSELFLCGALDRAGKFADVLPGERVREGERGREYVLVFAEESGTGRDIALSETDVENLMRAKAAIFAGINVLVESLDLTLPAIDEVVVAGGFGHYLDLERIMALGMFPELPQERFVFLGNSSLAGAKLGISSREMLKKAAKVAESVTYLELSVNASFMEMYVSSLFLPHTNTNLFPRTEALLAERAASRAVK